MVQKEMYGRCVFCGAPIAVMVHASKVGGCEDLGDDYVGLCVDCANPSLDDDDDQD